MPKEKDWFVSPTSAMYHADMVLAITGARVHFLKNRRKFPKPSSPKARPDKVLALYGVFKEFGHTRTRAVELQVRSRNA